MSLILDALKRAERERKAEATPVLADLAAPSADDPRRKRQYLRFGGIALLALIAGVLLWTVLRKAPQPQPETVTAVETPAPPAPAPAPSVIPGTEAVATLDDLTDETLQMNPPPLPAQAETATPAPAVPQPLPETPSAAPAPQRQAQAPPADTSPDAASQAPAAAPEIPPVLTQTVPLRKLREMPPNYRADFPSLSVEVHVYEREVAKRMVMINGRRYREGERLAEGPLLIEIVQEGIVFEHRGEKVLYTLGR